MSPDLPSYLAGFALGFTKPNKVDEGYRIRMSIDVIQSQNLEILLEAVLHVSSPKQESAAELFKAKYFIVPEHGTGQWLQHKIAERNSISANIHFMGLRTFQWEMYQKVLGGDAIAKAPQMLNMKWRIFLFLAKSLSQPLTAQHALFPIFQRIAQHSDFIADPVQKGIKQQQMLYWISDQTSRLFANYIIYRGQCLNGCKPPCHCRQNWLSFWGNDEALNIEKWIRQPEKEIQQSQPHVVEHAIAQAQSLEAWQRFIWKNEFAKDFADMQKIDTDFWDALKGQDAALYINRLPKQIYLFTLLELPPSQLFFLRQLAQYISVQIFHYTPSQEYWADSVDPKWKAKYALKYPEAAVYYESRHPLLTRLGKQARDISALLSQLAGGEEGQWQDFFPDFAAQNILEKIQSDILHLREPTPASYVLSEQDQSIQLHVCHSTLRQLEVLKDQLIRWLNDDSEGKRQAADILVLVPNLQDVEPLIRTVFAQNYLIQSESGQVNLPIKIAGVPLLDAVQLWQALTLRIKLLQQRFSLDQLMDWLSLLPIQVMYQLNFEDIQRISELLTLAGFKRGFDAKHLQQSLSPDDQDYRFSFRYALDRLTLAVAMPEHAIFADVLSLTEVRPSDFELISTLMTIYQDLDQRRDWLLPQALAEQQSLMQGLAILEQEIQHFSKVTGTEQVQQAIQKLKRIIEVTHAENVQLPLQYLLDEIDNSIAHQVGQTEPTGQITFAQMGQLRPLPYRLIVCLNLDTGTFPNRDNHIPFDLMELLRAELGDRSRLEDDQGAFLDALLQAKESFWMFYNGFDVNDHEVRDPSSIVQELVAHLAMIVAPVAQQPEKLVIDGIEIASQLKPLFHIHPLQPFDPKGFASEQYQRYQNQWFYVAQQITQPQQDVFNWLNQPYPQQSEDLLIINAQQWIADLSFPAKHFLNHVGIQNIAGLSALDNVEPLQLNGLQKYQVRDYLQQSFNQLSGTISADDPVVSEDAAVSQHQSPDMTQYDIAQFDIALLQDQLPIGKMQHATWQMAVGEYQLVAERLAYYGGQITALTQRQWNFNAQIQFRLYLPEDDQAIRWVSLSASKCRDERPLKIWLEYLLWRASSNASKNLQRIALYQNVTLILQGLTQMDAQHYLNDWLEVWTLAQQKPFILPPVLFANLFTDRPKWAFDDQGRSYIENYKKLEERWLGQKFYQSGGFDQYQDKGCCWQADWALLLIDQDARVLLNQFTEQYAARLYRPLSEFIEVVEA
ncbi:hypothetical protein CAP51_04525 [Acinetobacter populi]|uniref:RecBCD enzyme subunit RecC n=2 Tax=Acinetobacter populi TaxID=1582270 RepID=A0A1Z9Z352_9GAMM|nr:hypothetical protein CAP51_04525 [Acinetobacter populi]